MKWINNYLRCMYLDGGRGPNAYDCWGLVRHVRHFEMGFILLPSYGQLRNDNPKLFTRAYTEQSHLMVECEPEHGAIAAVLMGKICVHVAIVLEISGRLMILEINPERGARYLSLSDWRREHVNVTYHRDKK
jgi:hypothetical protein